MASLSDILTALKNGVTAINGLGQTIGSVFPTVGALSSSATVGGATLTSSQPATFLSVTTSSGGTYKVPLYLP